MNRNKLPIKINENYSKNNQKKNNINSKKFFTTNLEEINSDNYLINENVLPNSKNIKDYYQSL